MRRSVHNRVHYMLGRYRQREKKRRLWPNARLRLTSVPVSAELELRARAGNGSAAQTRRKIVIEMPCVWFCCFWACRENPPWFQTMTLPRRRGGNNAHRRYDSLAITSEEPLCESGCDITYPIPLTQLSDSVQSPQLNEITSTMKARDSIGARTLLALRQR